MLISKCIQNKAFIYAKSIDFTIIKCYNVQYKAYFSCIGVVYGNRIDI